MRNSTMVLAKLADHVYTIGGVLIELVGFLFVLLLLSPLLPLLLIMAFADWGHDRLWREGKREEFEAIRRQGERNRQSWERFIAVKRQEVYD